MLGPPPPSSFVYTYSIHTQYTYLIFIIVDKTSCNLDVWYWESWKRKQVDTINDTKLSRDQEQMQDQQITTIADMQV